MSCLDSTTLVKDGWKPVSLLDEEFNQSTNYPITQKVSILTYNICGLDGLLNRAESASPLAGIKEDFLAQFSGPRSRERWPKIANHIKAIINKYNVDTIAIQEAWDKSAHVLQNHLRFPYQSTKEIGWGLLGMKGRLTISRDRINFSKSFAFKDQLGIERVIPKGALLTEHDNGKEQKYQVWNIHLASDPEGSNNLIAKGASSIGVREKQIEELRQLIHRFFKPDIPVFITGDFNSNSPEDDKIILEKLGVDMAILRHGDRTIDFSHATFNPQTNIAARNKGIEAPARLDKTILYNSADIIYPQNNPCYINSIVIPAPIEEELSDHFALLTGVAW